MKPGRYILSPAFVEDPRGIGRHYRKEAGLDVASNVVYFRYAGDVIEVVRVLHERQDVRAELHP